MNSLHTKISQDMAQPGVVRFSVRNIYSIFIGLLPLLMYYRIPMTDFGLGTLLSAVFLPYVAARRYLHGRLEKKNRNGFIAIFFFYIIIRSSNNIIAMILYGIAMIHIIYSPLTMKWEVVKKTIIYGSFVASTMIILQRLMLIAGIHLSFFIKELMLDEFSYIDSVYSGEQLTRVSGIFAEPSHFAEYSLVGLIILLIEPGTMNKKKGNLWLPLLISIGILCSTSGIGLLGAISVWGYFILFCDKRMQHISFSIRIFILTVLCVICGVILYLIPVTRTSFLRITGSVDGYNAIWGRTLNNSSYLSQLNGVDQYVGFGATEMTAFTVGYVRIIYQYGYIGLGLMALLIIQFSTKKNKMIIALCAIYVGFLIASGMTGFLNYIFYFSVIYCGYIESVRIMSIEKLEFWGDR